ncbi:hypothetical protein BT96DRAFT_1000705 [Gymnopus androsaceus JB14]|uniref:Uncharacterized protein n=1 Tax=Gymnopus androsaceus JB14 TaxID=1447944 RepID=A0A6A4H1L0_9AGAR|nr:hypothetical protein BT96DRAFT_1000705 [Gymnopus androsaceus JB14]
MSYASTSRKHSAAQISEGSRARFDPTPTRSKLCTRKYGRRAHQAAAASLTINRVSSIATIQRVSSVQTVEQVSSGSSFSTVQRVSSTPSIECISSTIDHVSALSTGEEGAEGSTSRMQQNAQATFQLFKARVTEELSCYICCNLAFQSRITPCGITKLDVASVEQRSIPNRLLAIHCKPWSKFWPKKRVSLFQTKFEKFGLVALAN